MRWSVSTRPFVGGTHTLWSGRVKIGILWRNSTTQPGKFVGVLSLPTWRAPTGDPFHRDAEHDDFEECKKLLEAAFTEWCHMAQLSRPR